MTRFTTQSGSVYEYDAARLLIRWVSGNAPPTPRQGTDGAWKPCEQVRGITVGQPVTIVWQTVDSPEGPVLQSTITSLVTTMEET